MRPGWHTRCRQESSCCRRKTAAASAMSWSNSSCGVSTSSSSSASSSESWSSLGGGGSRHVVTWGPERGSRCKYSQKLYAQGKVRSLRPPNGKQSAAVCPNTFASAENSSRGTLPFVAKDASTLKSHRQAREASVQHATSCGRKFIEVAV